MAGDPPSDRANARVPSLVSFCPGRAGSRLWRGAWDRGRDGVRDRAAPIAELDAVASGWAVAAEVAVGENHDPVEPWGRAGFLSREVAQKRSDFPDTYP